MAKQRTEDKNITNSKESLTAKLKKQFSNIQNLEEPQQFIFGIIILGLIFVLMGGIFNLVSNPLLMGTNTRYLDVVMKSFNLQDQYIIESFIAGLSIVIGSVGIYFIRYSSRFAYDTKYSITLLVVGSILLVFSVIVLSAMYSFKSAR